jgi:4,5:9,10-diseco-3-hydroxy-5,9,17-trioxoandrosta-1(10),2-diene-4-oate hydrolase
MHSKQIKVGGLDIRYFTGGEGDPLVVIHGGGDGASGWLESVAPLCKKYRVYVPDLPGFGQSQQMGDKQEISRYVEFVEDFSSSLGLDSFHLMGHSIGGSIALRYALKFPHRIGKLVLVGSMFLGREMALWVRFLSHRIFRRTLGVAVGAVFKAVKWLVCLVYAPFKHIDPFPTAKMNLGESISAFKEQTAAMVNQLSRLVVPTLLVWGARDFVVPVRYAYAAAEVIPDCQLRVFPGCGHTVYKQIGGEFSQLLNRFLG